MSDSLYERARALHNSQELVELASELFNGGFSIPEIRQAQNDYITHKAFETIVADLRTTYIETHHGDGSQECHLCHIWAPFFHDLVHDSDCPIERYRVPTPTPDKGDEK